MPNNRIFAIAILILIVILFWRSCFESEKCVACEPTATSCGDLVADKVTICGNEKTGFYECNSIVITYPSGVIERETENGSYSSYLASESRRIEHHYGIPDSLKGVVMKPCLCEYPIFIYENDFPFNSETKTQGANDGSVVSDGGTIELNYIFEIEADLPASFTNYVQFNPSTCFGNYDSLNPNKDTDRDRDQSLNIDIHQYVVNSNASLFDSICPNKFTSDPSRKILALMDTGVHPGYLPDEALYYNPYNIHDCTDIKDPYGWNFVSNSADVSDNNGHGTVVAKSYLHGLDSKGASWFEEQQILPIKVLDSCGRGNLFDIICGLHYALDKEADVINMSLGANIKESNSFSKVMERAQVEKVSIVTSSGNSGDQLQFPLNSTRVDHYPSAYAHHTTLLSDYVYEVGASCYSPDNLSGPIDSLKYLMWCHSNHREGMFIEAGVNYQNLFLNYLPKSYVESITIHGTSMATPIFSSAVMARLLQRQTETPRIQFRNTDCSPIIGYHSAFR